MGKPHPLELRQRVVAHAEAGNTHRSAAERYAVSVKFVNYMVKLKRKTGSLAAKPQGKPEGGKLTCHADWVRAKIDTKGEVTLDVFVVLFAKEHQICVHRATVGRLLQRLGFTHKKRPASA
ncbi:helix-turn-helix domain-containing protein [Roseibium sp.]|uniref:helix-turn-helix domain-containing protein n=1 Tax=Roseibium sp. TaxID=1936156 RepID=UPI003B503DE7